MKRILLLIMSLFFTLAYVGCSKQEITNPDEDTEQGETGDAETAKFKVNQVSVQGYGKLLEGDELTALIPGLFYCNVTASASLEWNITLYRDGQVFYDKPYKGSKNVSVELPDNVVDQKVTWKLVVETSNEEIAETDRVYELNFTQAERPIFFLKVNGWTFGGALGGQGLEAEGSVIPAIIPVTEKMTAAECYMHIEASPEVAWTMHAMKNGEPCPTGNPSGVGTPENDPWWRPTDNVEPVDIEYTVVFVTDNEFVPEEEREVTLKFKQQAADGVLFTVTKWDLGGYGVVPEGAVLGQNLTGEFYPNISAASTVNWVMTVYRNDEVYGEPVPGSGSANPFFVLPPNESSEAVQWRIEIVTDNTAVAQQTLTLNFTQAGSETVMEKFTVDSLVTGTPAMVIKAGDTIPAELKPGSDTDAYSRLTDPNGNPINSWTAVIYRDDVEVGTASGGHFWLTNNTEQKKVTWRVVYSWNGQEVDFVFYQEAAAEITESKFEFTHIEGAYTFYPNQTNTLPAKVNDKGEQDLYVKVTATNDVKWNYGVTRNGEAWAQVQEKGEITGTGDFYFYVTDNDSSAEVTWVVTVTTSADVANPTQSITIVQSGK
ncbi:MAG: hypothetical protein IJ005_04245 [Bacteroidales bacterium]|nr:hypothetical protein [Bacteroidales bacterium]